MCSAFVWHKIDFYLFQKPHGDWVVNAFRKKLNEGDATSYSVRYQERKKGDSK